MTEKTIKAKTVKRKVKATAPDGKVITRTTARTYTHAVLFYEEKNWRGCPFWGYIGFCGTKELAEKLMRTTKSQWAKQGREGTFVLVPVEDA